MTNFNFNSLPNQLIDIKSIQINNINFDNINQEKVAKLTNLILEFGINVQNIVVHELTYVECELQYQLHDDATSKLIYLALVDANKVNNQINLANAIVLSNPKTKVLKMEHKRPSSQNANILSQMEIMQDDEIAKEVDELRQIIQDGFTTIRATIAQIQPTIVEVEQPPQPTNEIVELDEIIQVQRFTKAIVEKFYHALQVNGRISKSDDGKIQLLDVDGKVICSSKDSKYIVQRFQKAHIVEEIKIEVDVQVGDFIEKGGISSMITRIDNNLLILQDAQVLDITKLIVISAEIDENLGLKFVQVA